MPQMSKHIDTLCETAVFSTFGPPSEYWKVELHRTGWDKTTVLSPPTVKHIGSPLCRLGYAVTLVPSNLRYTSFSLQKDGNSPHILWRHSHFLQFRTGTYWPCLLSTFSFTQVRNQNQNKETLAHYRNDWLLRTCYLASKIQGLFEQNRL